jgi:Ca2+-binding EF-hand superfamily protein
VLNEINLEQEYDRDNSGTLSRLEFEEFLTKLGIFLKKQELTTVYNSFDTNKDGQINYEEFVNTLRVSFWEITASNSC